MEVSLVERAAVSHGLASSPRWGEGFLTFTKTGPIPGSTGVSYDPAAPLTEGRSMEAFQVVRARLQLGRGYATAAAGLRVAAQGETPRAQ